MKKPMNRNKRDLLSGPKAKLVRTGKRIKMYQVKDQNMNNCKLWENLFSLCVRVCVKS